MDRPKDDIHGAISCCNAAFVWLPSVYIAAFFDPTVVSWLKVKGNTSKSSDLCRQHQTR